MDVAAAAVAMETREVEEGNMLLNVILHMQEQTNKQTKDSW